MFVDRTLTCSGTILYNVSTHINCDLLEQTSYKSQERLGIPLIIPILLKNLTSIENRRDRGKLTNAHMHLV